MPLERTQAWTECCFPVLSCGAVHRIRPRLPYTVNRYFDGKMIAVSCIACQAFFDGNK